jgi:hypothetical protein
VFETKRVLTLSPAKVRQNGLAILKTYELFDYGGTQNVTNTVCKNMLKVATS